MLMIIATDDDDLDEIEMIICFMWKVIAIVFCISQGWGLILKSTCLSLDSNRVLNNALGTNNSFKWCVFGVESISGKA